MSVILQLVVMTLFTFMFPCCEGTLTQQYIDVEKLELRQNRYLKSLNTLEYLSSPSLGTDISQPISIIKCQNQTKCIQPALQLQTVYNVYFCKHVSQGGIRFYFLVREGLLLHPNINLVDSADRADFIVYLPESAAWDKSECSRYQGSGKLIVMDESDGPELFHPPKTSASDHWYAAYFKRSFVRRRSGVFKGYMNYLTQRSDIYPMTYTITEAYVRNTFARMSERKNEILCSLRDDEARSRVKQFLREYTKLHKLVNVSIGQVHLSCSG